MTKKQWHLPELLQQAEIFWSTYDKCYLAELDDIERLIELVRKDYLEEISGHTLKMVVKAVLHERDACAKLCESYIGATFDMCATAIRERSINSIFCSSSYPIINEER